MAHISLLCTRCRKEIGRSAYRKYIDPENDIQYIWHSPECWDSAYANVQRIYIALLMKAKRKELN